MGTQQIAEGSDLVTQPQLICPHLPETRKKEHKKERAAVWCPLQFSITHAKINSSPESENELKVAKLKSTSGFLGKPIGFLYWSAMTLNWKPALFLNCLTCHIAQPLAEERLLKPNSTDHTWMFAMKYMHNPFLSVQGSFTYPLNSYFPMFSFFHLSSVQESNIL